MVVALRPEAERALLAAERGSGRRGASIFDHWRVTGLHMGRLTQAGREMLVMVGQGRSGCW